MLISLKILLRGRGYIGESLTETDELAGECPECDFSLNNISPKFIQLFFQCNNSTNMVIDVIIVVSKLIVIPHGQVSE